MVLWKFVFWYENFYGAVRIFSFLWELLCITLLCILLEEFLCCCENIFFCWESFSHAVRIFLLPWESLSCCENFSFCCKNFSFSCESFYGVMRIFLLLEEFSFTVRIMVLREFFCCKKFFPKSVNHAKRLG